MLINAKDFGQNCKYFKLYEEDGTLIATSPSFDLEEGFYNFCKRDNDNRVEGEMVDGKFNLKLFQKYCKFKIVDSRTGEEFTDSKSLLDKNLLLKYLK